MDPSRLLINQMMWAVQNHDPSAFCSVVQRGWNFSNYVRWDYRFHAMPLIEGLTRWHFTYAIKQLLMVMKPCPVSRGEARQAFDIAISTGAPRSVVSVFIETSIKGDLPVMLPRDCFKWSMNYECWRLALRAIDMPEYNANECIHWGTGHYERPLHTAVRFQQLDIARLLLQKGAEVNAPDSIGITAVIIACGDVCLDLVRLLISFGANPNYQNLRYQHAWPFGSICHLTSVPRHPEYKSTRTQSSVTNKSDAVLDALLNAGLQPAADHWINHTLVIANMSQKSGAMLREMTHTLPLLAEAAIVQGMDQIRAKMHTTGQTGISYNEALSKFFLPNSMKQQLRIDLN